MTGIGFNASSDRMGIVTVVRFADQDVQVYQLLKACETDLPAAMPQGPDGPTGYAVPSHYIFL